MSPPAAATAPADTEYLGEVRPRRLSIALALNALWPGVGYVYCGRVSVGGAMAFFAMTAGVCVLAFGWLANAFVLKPVGVLVVLWAWLQVGMALELSAVLQREGPRYVLRRCNHPVVYVCVLLVTALPFGLGLLTFAETTAGLVEIHDMSMFPRLAPGDVLVVDKGAYRSRLPRRGELVVVQSSHEPARVLRVVGLPGEEVAVIGSEVYVNGEPLLTEQAGTVVFSGTLTGTLSGTLTGSDGDTPLVATVERSRDGGVRYPTFVAAGGGSNERFGPLALGRRELFCLGDRRDLAADSRELGAIQLGDVVGRPRRIVWSRAGNGTVRWDRLGLDARPSPVDIHR